jgi:hypothetical protein
MQNHLSKKIGLDDVLSHIMKASTNKVYFTFRIYYGFSSANLSIGSPVGKGAFLSTLYFNSSGKSIPTITFLPAATISDFGMSNL